MIAEFERQSAQAEDALSLRLGRRPGPVDRAATRVTPLPPELPAGVPPALLGLYRALGGGWREAGAIPVASGG